LGSTRRIAPRRLRPGLMRRRAGVLAASACLAVAAIVALVRQSSFASTEDRDKRIQGPVQRPSAIQRSRRMD